MLQRARDILNAIYAHGITEDNVRRVSDIFAPSFEEFVAVVILMNYYLNQDYKERQILIKDLYFRYPKERENYQPQVSERVWIDLFGINIYDAAKRMKTDDDLDTVTSSLFVEHSYKG